MAGELKLYSRQNDSGTLEFLAGEISGVVTMFARGKSAYEIETPTVSGTATYNGSSILVSSILSGYSSSKLKLGEEYSATDAGTYTATVTPINGYYWAWTENDTSPREIEWTISRKSISGATITLGDTPTYTSSTITQTVKSVVIDGLTATYSVSGNTGTDVKTYTLTCTGTGNFIGNQTANWKPNQASPTFTLSKTSGTMAKTADKLTFTATVNSGGTITATSSNTTIATVSVSGSSIICARVSDAGGSATITLTAASTQNYLSGTAKFELTVNGLTQITIPSQSGTLTYNGAVQTASWNNYSSSTSSVTGNTATDAGTHTATFTCASGYVFTSGSRTANVNWSINKFNLSNCTIADISDVTYTGSEYKPTPAVSGPGTTAPVVTTDFVYSYSNNVNAGTASCIITAVSSSTNYTGTGSKSFTINKAAGSITLSATSIEVFGVVGTTNTFTISSRNGDGALSVKSSNTSVCTASINGTTITVTSVAKGSSTITVSQAEGNNYLAASATCSATITIEDAEPVGMLCFTANTAGSKVTLTKTGSPSWTGSYWTTSRKVWTSYTPGTTGDITLTNVGDKIYFKGKYTAVNSGKKYLQFKMTGEIVASGNIMSFCSSDSYATTTTIPYSYMFYSIFSGCTSLTTAPEFPATTLTDYCYQSAFNGCTSLKTAPILPAEDLMNYCYASMFSSCTSLTTPSVLPATTVMSGCYSAMFLGCTSLTTPPALPATTLAQNCYFNMFANCTSLTTAPALPATTLADFCYSFMFWCCTSLYVSDTSTSSATEEWIIPSSETFTNTCSQSDMFTMCAGTRSSNNMPGEAGNSYTYYTQNKPVTTPKQLCFTANTAGSTITLTKQDNVSWTGSYSTDGNTWTTYTSGTTLSLARVGEKIYFKGTCTAENWGNKLQFTMTGSIAASGNIMSLCSGDDFESVTTIPYIRMFYRLFYECTSLTSAPELPATTLSYMCYGEMFRTCTSLTTAPKLPATTLEEYCYNTMFSGCTSLTTPPELPATTLVEYCYNCMFFDCTSLTVPPILPATKLVLWCYRWMFYGCTSLTTVPKLPATELATECYTNMFAGCNSLQVSDAQTSSATAVWTIPASGTFTSTYAQPGMFSMCKGTRSSDSMAGEAGQSYTYYTQNTPI